jgi:hypothetical protein
MLVNLFYQVLIGNKRGISAYEPLFYKKSYGLGNLRHTLGSAMFSAVLHGFDRLEQSASALK